MVSDVAINGAINLVNGILLIENYTLTLGGIYNPTGGLTWDNACLKPYHKWYWGFWCTQFLSICLSEQSHE